MLILLGRIESPVDEARIAQTPLATDVLLLFEARYQPILDRGLENWHFRPMRIEPLSWNGSI
jgi:hypothetical protein